MIAVMTKRQHTPLLVCQSQFGATAAGKVIWATPERLATTGLQAYNAAIIPLCLRKLLFAFGCVNTCLNISLCCLCGLYLLSLCQIVL